MDVIEIINTEPHSTLLVALDPSYTLKDRQAYSGKHRAVPT